MDTATLTLSEFLLARIGEDEAELGVLALGVRDESAGPNGVGWAEVGAINEVLMVSHARVLAECEAKRRIVEASRSYHEGDEDPDPDDPDGGWALSIALRALALPFADHPDYQEAWRP